MKPTQTYDHWTGDSCTGCVFGDHDLDAPYHKGRARRDYLERVARDWEAPVWPFVHACCQIDAPWFKDGWPLDPLVIPLLARLNERGVTTFSSCQGRAHYGPNVCFTGGLDAVEIVAREAAVKPVAYYDYPIVALSYPRDGQPSWNLWMHDTLSLIKWNRDVAGISVEMQVLDRVPTHKPSNMIHADWHEIEALL
jgi:hypothetical protein